MTRRAGPLLALAMVATIGAGCSNTPAETGSGAGGGTEKATDQERAVKFAQCVRKHGVPNFPDPNAKGEFVFGIDVTPAVWKRAVNACKDLQPPGSLSSKREPEEQTAALRFAKCMRQNGVRDFPDPVNGEPLVDTYRIPSSNRPGGMEILNAAMHKCRKRADQAVPDR